MPITDADAATFNAIEERYKSQLTDAQNADNAKIEAWFEDPANAEEVGGIMQATFDAADTDKTGTLTFPQFLDFGEKMMSLWVSKGGHKVKPSEEDEKTQYDILDKFNPDTPGVAFMDMMTAWGEMMARKGQ